MADAEIIQLGSRGKAGRGSGKAPSAAARGLAPARSPRARSGSRTTTEPVDLVEVEPVVDPVQSDDTVPEPADPVVPDSGEIVPDPAVEDFRDDLDTDSTGDVDSGSAGPDGADDPAGAEDAIGDDFGTPDIDDAAWAAAGEHGSLGSEPGE